MFPAASEPRAMQLATCPFIQDQRTVGLERLSDEQFGKFSRFIYERSGIRIGDKKVTLLSNRIRRRLRALGLEDFDVYYQLLTSPRGEKELAEFLDAVTTNETFFFRTPKQFDWFRHQWLNEVVADARNGRREPSLKIWSAGCANGAETYSIAICLAENAYRLAGWNIQILGTDISQEMLAAAQRGIYPPRMIEAIDESQRRRFFRRLPKEDRWEVRDSIRNMVEYKIHNLIRPLQRESFDCIFVRNVMIYFDSDSKQTAVRHIINALRVGGYLLIGPSEGIQELLKPLRRVSPLIYQKTHERASHARASHERPSHDSGRPERGRR